MKEVLKRLKKERTLCEIYENIEDSDKFSVGYIIAVGEEMFVLENVSLNGLNDGLQCIPIDGIIKIETETLYLKKIKKLMNNDNFLCDSRKFNEKNLLLDFLKYIQSEKELCEIELLNEYSFTLSGYIISLCDDIIEMNLIDETYGQPDGKGITKISDISSVSVKSEDLNKLKCWGQSND